MLKKSKLNVFGDSYATPEFCVAAKDSFWGLAAQDLTIANIDNYSHPGFSLDHVVHILLNEEFDFESDYFIVGIPPLIRYVAYNDYSGKIWNKKTYSTLFDVIDETQIDSLTNTQTFTFSQQFSNNRIETDRFSSEWNDVQCLEKIYLLHQYLTFKRAKFIIVNLSNPVHFQDMWPAGKNIMLKIKSLSECLMFENTYFTVNYNDGIKPADYDLYKWQGHHGAAGNKNWYTKVIEPKIKELGWL